MRVTKKSKNAAAHVFRGQMRIGTITRTKAGSVFEYDRLFVENLGKARSENEAGAIYRLPCSHMKTETPGVNLHPFFAGLLPEGLRLKALIKAVKTSGDDLLSLLMASGADCVGDIFVVPESAFPGFHSLVDSQKLEEVVFSELFKKSLSPDDVLEEANIPGVQDKVSASMISFPIQRKKDRSSCILKLTPHDKPRIIENEFFFLRMAKASGLQVNEAQVVTDKTGATGLLVKRFDRLWKKSGAGPTFVHQEDACQFLDRYPADKYVIPFSEIATGVAELCSVPIVEMGKLIRLKAFSYLIANGDLHAKNISLHTSPDTGRIELTPAYDLLSSLPYGDQKMALKLDGRDDNLKRKDFVAFGKRFEVKEPATRAILDDLCDVAPIWIDRLGEIGLPDKSTAHLQRLMQKRRGDLG